MSSWFEDQLKQRIQSDEDSFSEALGDISEVISGRRVFDELRDNEIANAKSAIDEIAKFYDVPDDVLKKSALNSNDEETLSERLENIFGSCGIMRCYVNLKADWYKDASGVYMAKTKEGSYAALIPDYYGYKYKDYSTGKYIRINSRTQNNLDSKAVCFYRPMPNNKLGVQDLMKYAVKSLSPSDWVYAVLITLFITLFSMIAPSLTRIIYSEVIYSKDISGLLAIFVFIVLSGISVILLQIAKALAVSRIEIKSNVSVNAAVMMRIINLPAEFFKKYSSGELAKRVSGVSMLCTCIVNVIFSVGLTAIISLIYLRQIFIFTPVLVKPALGIMAALFISAMLLIRAHAKLFSKKMIIQSKEYGLLYAFITGIQKIKLSGSERRAFAKWASLYKEYARLEYDPSLLIKLTPIIQTAITLIGTFILYFRAFAAGVAPDDYMAFMASYTLLSGAFIAFHGLILMAASVSPLIDLIKPVLEAVPEISQGKILSRLRGSIELNNVSFRYSEKSPLILDKLSLKIHSGEYVAIVGRSGCGKSTLMRLLLGFETPENGAIYYDSNDVKTLDLRSMRHHIGCVMQNSRLFSGSIYSNIVISAPQLTEQDAWEAAEIAGIADDIRKMPMKMETLISESANTISGGQKQRIIIARAIAPRPKILLFDEATSALDNITQKIVSDSLDKLKCTRIVIAHRLSTVRHCSRILVLDNGRIVEEGNYDELINNKGLFSSLVERQKLEI